MGTEMMLLLVTESVYWTNMNTDIKYIVKQLTMCLEYQHTQPQERALHYKIPCRTWEVISADTFIVNNKTLPCVVDGHSKFPIVKKACHLSGDDL